MKTQMLAAAAASLLTSGAARADYDFVQIDYPGAVTTSVYGINERGEVSGYGVDGLPTSFVYNSKQKTFAEVPAAPGMFAYVVGIDHNGAVVGSIDDPDPTNRSAFLRGPDGTYSIF